VRRAEWVLPRIDPDRSRGLVFRAVVLTTPLVVFQDLNKPLTEFAVCRRLDEIDEYPVMVDNGDVRLNGRILDLANILVVEIHRHPKILWRLFDLASRVSRTGVLGFKERAPVEAHGVTRRTTVLGGDVLFQKVAQLG
jgi:hypothetical protein